jgi:protein-disulfide isomerase
MIFSKLEWRIRWPYLLLLPVLVAGVAALNVYYPFWKGCSSFSDSDRQRVSSYLSKRFGLGDVSGVEVYAGTTLPGTCTRKLNVRSSHWKQDQSFLLSSDKRYLFRGVDDLTAEPKQIAADVAAAPNAVVPVDMAELTAGNPPSLGPSDAPVTLVEFSDFQCPFCKRFAATLKDQVLPEEKGRLRLVFRQFPLPMHSHAKEEAELSACVAGQSMPVFWALNDYLFNHQVSGEGNDLVSASMQFLRTQKDANVASVQACINKHAMAQKVDEDVRLGQKYGVTGTPTFFVNGQREVGAKDEAALKQLIDQVIMNPHQPAIAKGKGGI